jgi:hypothetical protein
MLEALLIAFTRLPLQATLWSPMEVMSSTWLSVVVEVVGVIVAAEAVQAGLEQEQVLL